MTSNDSNMGYGAEPAKEAPQDEKGKTKDPVTPAPPGEIETRRLDGIDNFGGTVTFTDAGTVTLDATIEGDGSGASQFNAYGDPGNSVSTNGNGRAMSQSGDDVSASGLPAYAAGTNYTVAITYFENNVRLEKKGTVNGRLVTSGGSAQVTLS